MGAAGSEVAIHSATIALMNNDLRRLPFLVKLSRSTRSIINQNFLFGTLFIIFGLTFASWGYINPILAALLHNAGSLIVVFNSARLVRQGEELDNQLDQKTEEPPAARTGSCQSLKKLQVSLQPQNAPNRRTPKSASVALNALCSVRLMISCCNRPRSQK